MKFNINRFDRFKNLKDLKKFGGFEGFEGFNRFEGFENLKGFEIFKLSNPPIFKFLNFQNSNHQILKFQILQFSNLKFLIFIFFTFSNSLLFSQELSNIGKGPVVTVDGGLSMNQVWSKTDVPSGYRKPYAYTLAANLTFSLYGWAIPVSAVFSNQNWSYQQPFNQFSLHPSYKWVKTHIGYSSMTFSSYTLSGHQFLGGGVELTPPGNWKFSAMTGRLQKRVLPDSARTNEPAYLRYGSGFKTEYTFSSGNFGVSMFYARDMASSLAGHDDSISVTPQKNLALSVDGNFSFLQVFSVNFEYGTSMFTDDVRAASGGGKYALLPFYQKNVSSHQYHAFRTNLAYNTKIGSVGVGVERIEPGYKTLGAYYSNNDFINYTLNFSGRAIQDKVNLSVSSGLQRDNLDGNKQQETKRLVNSVTVGFSPSQVVNLGLMYSNFSNYTNVRSDFEEINNTSPYGNLDTLDYTQISQTTGLNLNLSPKGTEEYRHNFMFSANYQQASDKQGDNPTHAGNKFINGMTGYSGNFLKKNFTVNANFNYNRNIADSIITIMLGPTLGVRKGLFDKKMNINLSVSYNINKMNNVNQSAVWLGRIGSGYTLKERHTFDLSAVYAYRNNMVKHTTTNEITVTFTYQYNFSLFKKRDLKN